MKYIQQRLSCPQHQGVVLLFLVFTPLLVFLKTSTIFGGDGGDLVTAAFVQGVAHPPGYPLYTAIAYLLTHLPQDMVAGRVVWLSVIPAIGSIVLSFLITFRISKNSITSLFTALILGFSYLFLLLAIIPEVFALHLFLTALLVYLLLEWQSTGRKSLFSWFCFFFGLSLTHHHTILLLTPAFLYIILLNWHTVHKKILFIIHNSLFIILGLLPYAYVYFAARGNPVINWENPQTLSGFIRLVSRAIYGTFQSGQFFGRSVAQRLYHLPLFFETMLIDFTVLGIFLAFIGLLYLLFTKRRFGIFVLLGFVVSGPLFLFYASFPIGMNFQLGTVERFYLVPYFFIALAAAFGIEMSTKTAVGLARRFASHLPLQLLFSVVFAIYPLALALTTIPKLIPLRHDHTAENVGYDVLRTIQGTHNLLLLTEDTRLFNTSYVYVTNASQSDTRLIFLGLLPYPFYRNDVVNRYTDITFPDATDASASAEMFIVANTDAYTMYAERPYPVPDRFRWVPWGILYKLYNVETQTFDADAYRADMKQLFAAYQDPLAGALGSYKHVMLADVLRVYGNAYESVGVALGKLGFVDDAQYLIERSALLLGTPQKNTSLVN